MNTICCVDCKKTHQCGVECCSRKCFDENCCCDAKEIASGLYHCKTCNLLVTFAESTFADYFSYVTQWYENFYKKHKNYFRTIEQKKLSTEQMDEHESIIYETIDRFCVAKSNFSLSIPSTMQLSTKLLRKNAYMLYQAFEEIKKLQI